MAIEWVGLDADDTLWHSEDGFNEVIAAFLDLVSPYTDAGHDDVEGRLLAIEHANLEVFGYGVKGFTLSMIEAAVELSGGAIPSSELARVVALGRELMRKPVELLDGVADVVAELAGSHRLLLITKGDLLHQETKVIQSGLEAHFHAIEIVSEKHPEAYRRVLRRHGIAAEAFVMVGNSVKSDVLPVLAIGGTAVHIPYEFLWGADHAEHDGTVPELSSIRDLPGWLAGR
jgi:putative hydrolase of the HAD superfamily